jgi:hypothetical protein
MRMWFCPNSPSAFEGERQSLPDWPAYEDFTTEVSWSTMGACIGVAGLSNKCTDCKIDLPVDLT